MTATVSERSTWTSVGRYRRSLWLLTTRDLKVRYSTSALGYLWSIIDPLIMSAIYFFVFTVVFHRGVGHEPYIVFLLTGLMPWTWFNGSVSEATRAFSREAKLIRSTKLPSTIWIVRVVLSKGIEFLLSFPVIAVFAVGTLLTSTPAVLHREIALLPLALVLEAVLSLGVALIVAPLVVFFKDLERATKLGLRFLFYASPIIYGVHDLPARLDTWAAFNPMFGILSLYRSVFFPQELNWEMVAVGSGMTVLLFVVGLIVFTRSERAVLKAI